MPTSVLVTGASGFAGGHLVQRLAANAVAITAWAHRGGHEPPRDIQATWDVVDLLDRAGVEEAVARCRPDVVYHCAGAAQAGAAWDRCGATLEVNVLGTVPPTPERGIDDASSSCGAGSGV